MTIWFQSLYPTDDPPIPTARWEEAQLIVAEAELDAGNTDAAAATITAVRTESGLPAYGGGTAAETGDQPIEERRRTLRLQSHRVGEMPENGVPSVPAGITRAGRSPGKPAGSYRSRSCRSVRYVVQVGVPRAVPSAWSGESPCRYRDKRA